MTSRFIHPLTGSGRVAGAGLLGAALMLGGPALGQEQQPAQQPQMQDRQMQDQQMQMQPHGQQMQEMRQQHQMQQPQGQQMQQDQEAALRELQDQWKTAFTEGNVQELAGLYAEDAMLMAPDAPTAEGRTGIEEYLRTGLEVQGRSEITIETVEAKKLGDAVLDIGTFTRTPEGGAEPVTGEYAALLEKDPQGAWKITRHIWNEDRPEDGAVAEER